MTRRRIGAALALCLMAPMAGVAARAEPASADPDRAPLPPAPPWHGSSERLIARAGDPWITPAETSGLTATPSYAETRAYLDRLAAASPLLTGQARHRGGGYDPHP